MNIYHEQVEGVTRVLPLSLLRMLQPDTVDAAQYFRSKLTCESQNNEQKCHIGASHRDLTTCIRLKRIFEAKAFLPC